MARPTKLTPELADGICQRLRAGVPRAFAAESQGIHRDSFYAWMALGKAARGCVVADCDDDHHGPTGADLTYSEFSDTVERAEADAVALAVSCIAKGMSKDWRAAMAWLERRHPEEFKPRAEVATKADATLDAPFEIVLIPNARPQEELGALAGVTGPASGADGPDGSAR